MMEIDVVALLTFVGVLAGIVSASVEWLKALLANATWDDAWSEDIHVWLVRTFAVLMGMVVAVVAQFDVIHVFAPTSAVNVNVCYVLSGLLLVLPADGLKTALQWLKAIRDAKEGQAEATRAWSAAPIPPSVG